MLETGLRNRVLARLGFSATPEPTLAGLTSLYGAWCRMVPFDNIRKLIHLRRGDAGPLPGTEAAEFFEAWLRHGTGGTCWSGHTAWHALLASLEFNAVRGVGTMLVAPDLPPNHATVFVHLGDTRYLVDASILHGEPLPVSAADGGVAHGAWGVQTRHTATGQLMIRWRPIHMAEGLDCRIDTVDVPATVFVESHEKTRAWSPINYGLYARINRGDRVVGAGMGQWIAFDAAGGVAQRTLHEKDRVRILVEELGISEEMARAVPADVPMPPPPKPA
ncbi:MAG: arylamine N-acetyltransferase [Panacagrimonas sp.]